MKKKLLLVFLLMLSGWVVNAQTNLEPQLNAVKAKIAEERQRILTSFQPLSEDFISTLDSAIAYVPSKTAIATTNKIRYEERLLNYLRTITKKEKIINRKYYMGLLFYKTMVDKSENSVFTKYVKEHSLFTFQYIPLFADDAAAYQLLEEFIKSNPDMVLKNFDLYSNQAYASRIIEKIAYTAPEKVKNYFISNQTIKNIIYKSTMPECVAIKNIYNAYGYKSKAYWLIYKINSSEYSIKQADSIGANPLLLFKNNVEILNNPNPPALYNIKTECSFFSADYVRNLTVANAYTNDVTINKFNIDELFVFMVYGYQDATPNFYFHLMSLLSGKQGKVSKYVIENITEENLINFIKFCDNNNLLQTIIQKIAPENHGYILAALSTEETQEELPMMISYNKKDVVPAQETENKIPVKSEPIITQKEEPASISAPDNAIIPPAKFNLSEEQKLFLKAKKNIFLTMQNINSFIDGDQAEEILFYAADKIPEEIFRKYDKFKHKYFAIAVVEKAAINSPTTLKRYILNPANPICVAVSQSQNPIIKKMYQLKDATSFYTKPYILFDLIYNGKLTVEDAISITNNQDKLLKEIIKIVSNSNDYIGKNDIEKELSYLSLRFIRSINDKINEPESERFKSAESLTPDELYYVMTYGRLEVLASTFNGVYDRFNRSLPASFSDAVLDKFAKQKSFKTFITLCVNYNKLDNFLQHFNTTQQKKIFQKFASDLDKDDDFNEPIMVSEAIINSNNTYFLETIQNEIKKEYTKLESENNYAGMTIYGILANLSAEKVLVEKDWFKVMKQKYRVADLSTFSPETLKNNNAIIERIYFYNDEDGKGSYANFLKNYKSNPNWTIEENYNYIKIVSLSGNKIIMYANKPEFEETGDATIIKTMQEQNQIATFVVHRGHSFHTEKTLEKTNSNTKLIFVGSCGGFYKTSIATRNAPEAHIISSKQWASQTVNEPVLNALNEKLRSNQRIVWRSFWEEMKGKLSSNKLFDDYVPPHKNLESLFVKAFYQILEV